MPKRNCGWDNARAAVVAAGLVVSGCATTAPVYSIRPTPVPDESASAIHIERGISQVQGEQFERQDARPIGPSERVAGFTVQKIIDGLSRVTERPNLHYRAYLYPSKDPNAAALADGRIYISTGLLEYLGDRGSREDELAFILGHELAHTVAQHLVKRYYRLQQQQLLLGVLAAAGSAITKDGGAGASRLAVDIASLLADVSNSGYSQEHELEADQLGVRYLITAAYDPKAGLDMLKDFERFDSPNPIMRSHPYIRERRAHLERYLTETGQGGLPPPPALKPAVPTPASDRLRQLRDAQRLYPAGSVSWKNLQAEIDRLERARQ